MRSRLILCHACLRSASLPKTQPALMSVASHGASPFSPASVAARASASRSLLRRLSPRTQLLHHLAAILLHVHRLLQTSVRHLLTLALVFSCPPSLTICRHRIRTKLRYHVKRL